ncbi:MAG: DNA gyrase subunit A [Coprobacillus sp.]|nr:DNA gyrase subunit A [Coprobacillus sp.]
MYLLDDDEEITDDEEVSKTPEEEEGEDTINEVNDTALEDDELEEGIVPGLSDVPITDTVKNAFLDYAMSVIVARAIPDVRDGFKPVHRRILFGMNEGGYTPDKPYNKCAKIVGDVMGNYHPHGDAAIYQTLVRMAQNFSMRYPLVDGHGNFGSVDGDEAAAMRYTEARMSKISLEMVRDIDADTVDFVDNYDGTEKEPVVLPSRIPNLLINGSSGIAVGMATNIPPHNLGEIIDAIVAVAHNPEIDTLGLLNIVKGPDFPTGGIILGKGGIRDAYETGTGSIAIRSKCEIQDRGEKGGKRIVVTEIPYQVNKANMIEHIVELARDKVIDGITEVRDESNKDGVRVVIEVRRDVIPEVLLNQLYKNTQLQVSYGIIMLCLIDGAPKVASLKEILQSYLDFQIEVIERRTKHLLAKDEARDHIVVGLLKCHDNIDDIIEIIKNSDTPESAGVALKEKYEFSDEQLNAIMGMSLRRLTGIETQKLENERAQLEANITEYHHILESRENETEVVLKELLEIKEKYADERKTVISNDLSSIDDEDLIPEEDIVIALTKNGYIKRLPNDSFRTQNRGGRGVRGMHTNDNDIVDILVSAKTHTDLLFFTSLGKVYRTRGHAVPEYGKNSKGLPIVNVFQTLEKDEQVKAIICVDEYAEDRSLMFFTEQGVVKKTPLKEFESIRANGKIALNMREGDSLVNVKEVESDTLVSIGGSNGKLVSFPASEVRDMGRTATGVKGIDLPEGARVVGVTTALEGKNILVITDKGYGKMSDAQDYRITKRGAKGVITLHVTDRIGDLIDLRAVNGDEDLMVITTGGVVIRTPLSQLRISGRNTQGVKIINLEGRQKVSSIAVVAHEEEDPLLDLVEAFASDNGYENVAKLDDFDEKAVYALSNSDSDDAPVLAFVEGEEIHLATEEETEEYNRRDDSEE